MCHVYDNNTGMIIFNYFGILDIVEYFFTQGTQIILSQVIAVTNLLDSFFSKRIFHGN